MRPAPRSAGRVVALILGALALVVLLVNAHLVYVAATSQPDCVALEDAAYRAARPAC